MPITVAIGNNINEQTAMKILQRGWLLYLLNCQRWWASKLKQSISKSMGLVIYASWHPWGSISNALPLCYLLWWIKDVLLLTNCSSKGGDNMPEREALMDAVTCFLWWAGVSYKLWLCTSIQLSVIWSFCGFLSQFSLNLKQQPFFVLQFLSLLFLLDMAAGRHVWGCNIDKNPIWLLNMAYYYTIKYPQYETG